jgi:small basic protein
MLALLGLIIGLVIGLFLNFDIPQAYSVYVGVGILACFDSIVGALTANMQRKFNIKLFISGLIGNSVIAVGLAALGDQLGISLYLAAVFAFGNRIFINFSIIRRLWLHRLDNKINENLYNERRDQDSEIK